MWLIRRRLGMGRLGMESVPVGRLDLRRTPIASVRVDRSRGRPRFAAEGFRVRPWSICGSNARRSPDRQFQIFQRAENVFGVHGRRAVRSPPEKAHDRKRD